MSNRERMNVSDMIENFPGTEVIRLHLADYFRSRKSAEEIQAILEKNGFWGPGYDPVVTPLEVREQMRKIFVLMTKDKLNFRWENLYLLILQKILKSRQTWYCVWKNFLLPKAQAKSFH